MAISSLFIVTPEPLQVSSATAQLKPVVAVVMGSDSDLETLQPAIQVLERFEVAVEVRILSAHRTPIEMVAFAQQAKSKGLKVIIAGAGGAAHLPGMIASLTSLPVIGVPVQSKALSGVDSMHSIVQMPGGIPVATVAIDGGLNAGLLASQILALSNQNLEEQIMKFREAVHDEVTAKDAQLIELGPNDYLTQM